MIDLIDVNKYYKNEEECLHVLKNINLQVSEGEIIAIMGPSGSGKSTLINLLGFIDQKFDGQYLFKGKSLINTNDDELSKIRNQTVGFIFQNFSLIENNTVFENVELPLLYGGVNTLKQKKKYSCIKYCWTEGKRIQISKAIIRGTTTTRSDCKSFNQ